MIRHPRSTRRGVLGAAALFIATAALFVLGGLNGVLFGAVAAVAWLVLPAGFAFTIGQAGLAAVTTLTISPPLIIAELALLALLVTDASIRLDLRAMTIPFFTIAVLGLGVYAVAGQSIIGAAALSLAGSAALVYTVHRYELLTTNQLPMEADNE